MKIRKFLSLLSILILSALLAGCFGGGMDRGKAMKALLKLPIFSPKKDDVYVEDVSNMGKSTIITAKIRIALSGIYKDKKFTPEEIRIGNGDWVPISFFKNTLLDYRYLKTRENMLKLSTGIINYALKNGKYPDVTNITDLLDMLHPKYIDEIVEMDGWNNFLSYKILKNKNGFRLISPGKDKKLFTKDDIIYENGEFK